MDGRDVPEYFNPEETYHCTFCSKKLGFIADSTISRLFYDNIRCYPCTAIAQMPDPDRGRSYNERAVPYINAILNQADMQQINLPVHVYQAYVRQLGAILDGKMTIALQEAS